MTPGSASRAASGLQPRVPVAPHARDQVLLHAGSHDQPRLFHAPCVAPITDLGPICFECGVDTIEMGEFYASATTCGSPAFRGTWKACGSTSFASGALRPASAASSGQTTSPTRRSMTCVARVRVFARDCLDPVFEDRRAPHEKVACPRDPRDVEWTCTCKAGPGSATTPPRPWHQESDLPMRFRNVIPSPAAEL